ncbi:HRDC domain-containing protein [uncultured Leifsonia sp.]|uniref:HRDC domain-containing protein n=1 Tax=uncultured Leifsonia sp. TaxID=340359 RepID=UPI0028D1A041|nr:HRDC domain-containing protein [uncultured Leifsonia sp.]
MADHIVIDSRAGYLAAVETIVAGTGPVAVDAERASGFRYSQRAYLIQMYRRGSGTFLFDPPAIGRFDELNTAIHDDEWVLHAATQDLTCLREVGLDPARIFDTELAARLLGMPRVGLGTVVEELLGIHLAKEHSAADWSTRPLPEPWLNYAALDVELLPDLRDAIDALLVEAGKEDIAHQEFADELTRELITVRREPWRRLSGIHSVRGIRNLAVARELWLSRDALARELDVAPGRLVPDAALTAVAKAMPESKRALAALREFTGRASRTELDRWWAAVEAGRTTDDLPVLRGTGDSLPPPRAWADRNPEADARLKAARAELTAVAEELSLPLENLLTPETLRRIAWTPPQPITPETVADALREHGARPWQIEATSQVIARAFVESVQSPDAGSEAVS